MGTGRGTLSGCGTQTAGLAFGGDTGNDGSNTGITEEYNGSTWTSGGTMSTARRGLSGCGIQTAGLAIGGYTTTASSATARI
jgi:hypothetical protein